jgi:ceramide glucosyltransferase
MPLAGAEEGLRENLRGFFEQDYPEFEMLFGVADADHAAVRIAQERMALYPHTPSRLVVSGDAPTPNRKVHNLRAMTEEARYDVLVMADSDVRVSSDLLRLIASEMLDPAVQVVTTCPYRASAGPSTWTTLEAIGLKTEFLARVLMAQMVGPMDFALGPTLAIRRQALTAIGRFQ